VINQRRLVPLIVSIALVAGALVAGSAPTQAADGSSADGSPDGDRVPGAYIVDLKPGVSARKFAKKIANQYGGDATFTYDDVVGGFAFSGPDSAASKIAKDRRVEGIEQDRVARIADDPPSDLSHLNRDRVPEAVAAGYTGAGVRIAMLDTGIDAGHEVFQAHGNAVSGHNCGGGGDSTNDRNGHGTATASNAAGRIGVAHEATVIAVRVFPGAGAITTWQRVICGLQWVVQNSADIDIVNISIAGPGSRALKKAIAAVVDAGIVVVAAAGNNGGATQAPGRYRGVIAASALAAGDAMASFSSTGGNMTAPGVSIKSADKNNGYSARTGTSHSSPQVAGAAAVVLGEDPAADVLTALRTSGTCPGGGVNGSSDNCAGQWQGDDANAEPLINAYCAGVFADPVAVDLTQCGF
jgi:subtilisin